MGIDQQTYSAVFAGAVRDLMRDTGTNENQLSLSTDIPRATLGRRLRGGGWKASEMAAVAAHFGLSVSAVCARGEQIAEEGAA